MLVMGHRRQTSFRGITDPEFQIGLREIDSVQRPCHSPYFRDCALAWARSVLPLLHNDPVIEHR
jgi:hypothetical protein